MTSFLLSRASSISRASSYPLTSFTTKLNTPIKTPAPAAAAGRSSLQYMLGDEGGVG